ncbi:hypothetical protein XA67_06725 [Comamonas thiooxydans]|nr:hypothetical protein XA67_06725 [Comamonas thiooxydans]
MLMINVIVAIKTMSCQTIWLYKSNRLCSRLRRSLLRQLCSQGLQLRLRELGDKVQHGVALERIGRRQDGEPADLTRSPKRPEHDLLAVEHREGCRHDGHAQTAGHERQHIHQLTGFVAYQRSEAGLGAQRDRGVEVVGVLMRVKPTMSEAVTGRSGLQEALSRAQAASMVYSPGGACVVNEH